MTQTLRDGTLDDDPDSAAVSVIASLVPFQDPKMAGFQRRSFKSELIGAVQQVAEGRFENLRYRPSWLNAVDFENIAAASQLRAVSSRGLENVEGLHGFLRYMGAREGTLEDLKAGLSIGILSSLGAAEIIAHIAKLHATKQLGTSEIDAGWRLWSVDGVLVTLAEAQRAAKPLDQSFADIISERVGVGSELRRLIAALLDPVAASQLSPDRTMPQPQQPEHVPSESQNAVSSSGTLPRRLSLKKWRSAEQQVLSLLELQGWIVTDVSRQNVGYDIEGLTPENDKVFIEVKAIDNPGQPFTLTSNEEATARQVGEAYQLAIVRQAGADLEVAFIKDPANQLELIRQCRQWVWECSSYVYNPERFLLE